MTDDEDMWRLEPITRLATEPDLRVFANILRLVMEACIPGGGLFTVSREIIQQAALLALTPVASAGQLVTGNTAIVVIPATLRKGEFQPMPMFDEDTGPLDIADTGRDIRRLTHIRVNQIVVVVAVDHAEFKILLEERK